MSSKRTSPNVFSTSSKRCLLISSKGRNLRNWSNQSTPKDPQARIPRTQWPARSSSPCWWPPRFPKSRHFSRARPPCPRHEGSAATFLTWKEGVGDPLLPAKGAGSGRGEGSTLRAPPAARTYPDTAAWRITCAPTPANAPMPAPPAAWHSSSPAT